MKPPKLIHDASIVLVGVRGTGRSTLALFAKNLLGYGLVDADIQFRKTTRLSEQEYATKYSQQECRDQQVQVMRSITQNYPSKTIIVIGLSAALEPAQQLLLEFGVKHPIIYVMRDPQAIAGYFRNDDLAMVSNMVDCANPIFRKLSNFEFYNLQDAALSQPESYDDVAGAPAPSLLLKSVERDILQHIRSICAPKDINIPQVEALSPVTSVAPLEARPYTYALPIAFSKVPALASRLQGIDLLADVVELVIDLTAARAGDEQAIMTSISRAFYILRRLVSLPIIYHIKGLDELARSDITPLQITSLSVKYVQIFQHGLRLTPDYITIDLHLQPEVLKMLTKDARRTKLIGHFYDANPQPNAWDSHFRKSLLIQAEELKCRLVRICQRPVGRADNTSLQRFYDYVRKTNNRIPVSAYNTGTMGRISILLNHVLTPVMHPQLRAADPFRNDDSMDWLPDVPEALEALYTTSQLHALSFGIFGSNVHASISPYMHNAAFAYSGMPHTYKTNQSPSLQDITPILHDIDFGGASITNPFKSEILPLLDNLSPAARAIGAVNTVIPLRSKDSHALLDRGQRGKVLALYGDNTDWIGIFTCIHRNLSPINAIKGRTIGLVLGAGGMARAAIYSMIHLNVKEIYICNRTQSNAERVVAQFFESDASTLSNVDLKQSFGPSRITVLKSVDDAWPAATASPNVIVSCIPNPTILLPDSWLASKTGGVFIELSYTTLDTPLLSQVAKCSHRGWIAVNGLDVLPEQGISQFELFTGRKAPRNVMRQEVQSRCLGSGLKDKRH